MQDNSEIQRSIGAAHRSSDHGSDVGDDEHDGFFFFCKTKEAKTKTSESSPKSSEDKDPDVVLMKAQVNLNHQHC